MTTYLKEVFFCAAWIFLAAYILRRLFFLPYRNRFMRWYMSRFNGARRASHNLYTEILRIEESCRTETGDRHAAWSMLLGRLYQDNRFRTLDFAEEWFGMGTPLTSDDILSGTVSVRDYEMFIAFFGHDGNFHKVTVFFNLSGECQLQSVHLFYHEERGSGSFLHEIAEVEFPNEPPTRQARPCTVKPLQPVHA